MPSRRKVVRLAARAKRPLVGLAKVVPWSVGLLDVRKHLEWLGEAALAELGEDQLAVDQDLECALCPHHELGIGAGFLFDEGRQTGGARIVVSDLAVLDFHPGH